MLDNRAGWKLSIDTGPGDNGAVQRSRTGHHAASTHTICPALHDQRAGLLGPISRRRRAASVSTKLHRGALDAKEPSASRVSEQPPPRTAGQQIAAIGAASNQQRERSEETSVAMAAPGLAVVLDNISRESSVVW